MYNVCINIGIYLKSKIFLLSCDLYNSSIIRHSVITRVLLQILVLNIFISYYLHLKI